MKKMVVRLVLMAGLGLTSPLIAAQVGSPGGANEAEIVIEGRKERQRQIRRFVGALTDAPIRGQIARFEWKVCPVAVGIPDHQANRVVQRLRRVGQTAGVPLADPGCEANAIIIVTPEKKETMRMIRREYPQLFRTDLGERIRPDVAAPVSAWQVQGRLTQDGQDVPVAQGNMGTYYETEVTRASSRLSPATRPHFKATVLVVQLDALRGLTLTQFADYAAMRIFAQTDPSRLDRSTVPTILNIVDTPMGAEVPLTLTQWDLSFLRALYGSAENRYAEQQRQEMRRRLENDLDDGHPLESE